MTTGHLTRNDIIRCMSERHIPDLDGITMAIAETVLRHAVNEIATAVLAGYAVRLHGFGAFVLHERPARTGRNPKTGEAIEIPARREMKFRPAKDLKARAARA